MGSVPTISGLKASISVAIRADDLFDQLRTVKGAAVADGGHETRHLQGSDQHVALTDGLVGGFDLSRRVEDLAGFLFHAHDAGQRPKSEGVRHLGNITAAVVAIEVETDMTEIWVAGTHQPLGQGQQTGGQAVAGVAKSAITDASLTVIPGPVVQDAVGEFGEVILAIVGGLWFIESAFESGRERDDLEDRAEWILSLRGAVVHRDVRGH